MTSRKMFHISKRLDWQVGDNLVCGIDYNPFWITCANYNPKTSWSSVKITDRFFEKKYRHFKQLQLG